MHLDLTGKNILFFAPKFFGYERKIIGEIEDLGGKVTFHSDKPLESNWFKAILRLFPKLVWPFASIFFEMWLDQNDAGQFDIIFIIKGEGLSPSFLRKLRTKHPSARFVLYMWDSIRNVRYTESKLELFDKVSSFDLSDCKNYPTMRYRSLFFLEQLQPNFQQTPNRSIFFVGTLNGDRSKVLAKVIGNLNDQVPFDYVLFVRSKFELILKKMFDRSISKIGSNHLVFNALSSKSIKKRMSVCSSVLDIEHPKQTGLTMRSFEVLAVGKKLITTNQSIVEHEFYDESRVCLINREDPIITLDFLDSKFNPLPDSFYKKYSICGWLKEVLS